MLNRSIQKNRQSVIGSSLILHRAANEHIIVSVSPIVRNALHKSLNSLRKKIKQAVASLSHHTPAFCPPFIRIFQQKVGSKACKYNLSTRQFIASVPFSFHRVIKISCLAANAACAGCPIHLILPVHIAVSASRADFGAAVPGVPVHINFVIRV